MPCTPSTPSDTIITAPFVGCVVRAHPPGCLDAGPGDLAVSGRWTR